MSADQRERHETSAKAAMRVTLFARVDPTRNPYILLYKTALERQGLKVDLERDFSLNWLIRKGKSCDAIHLHWIEAAYRPSMGSVRPGVVGKLINNRVANVLRGALRLANFSAALFWAKLQRKVIVYTVHNLNIRSSEQKFWPFIILNRVAHYVVFSLSNQIHVHSHYTRKEIEADYRRSNGITVVPHGSYIGSYPNQVSQLEARRQLGLPDDVFVYLFLGQIHPYKGIDQLIDAFEKLALPKARLLIAGQVSEVYDKEQLLSWIDHNPAIKLVPEFIPNELLQLYMNAGNICVLPYKDNTTSGSALLALSFGRPIIGPTIGSLPELVTAKTGILYDPSQANALLLALQQARQQSWSETDIFDYAYQFDWDRLGPQLAALYQG